MMENNEKDEPATWILKVPKSFDKIVTDFISKDTHMTKSEFIRQAVREKLGDKIIEEGLEENRTSG